MGGERFPLKYGAEHDSEKCYCRVAKRSWLHRRRWRYEQEGLESFARDLGRVIEVEVGRLYWLVSEPCWNKERQAAPRGHVFCRLGQGEPSPGPSSRYQPSKGAHGHWSDNPGRMGGGGFMG
ncbi:hypothetical protein A4V12_23195 [Streptomyces noursei]|nr:hypothetical protein A4V12_23195 [Streptomyces noursei]